jgi:ABC-type transporter Mla MlaB component
MDPSDQPVAVRLGEHACSRLASAGDRRLIARAFVTSGLALGHKVLYLCDGDRAEVVADLAEHAHPIEAALASGQLEVRSAPDTYMPDGAFDIDRMILMASTEHDQALADGYPALSLTGEMTWALCGAPGIDERIAEYERRLADAAREPTLVILCQYDHARFAAGLLGDIAATHAVDVSPELAPIARTGYLSAARAGSGATLRLSGELDFACAEAVAGVLDAHFHGRLRVDLADVSFADVTGLRALRGRRGQTLTIAAASDAVWRLIGLLAWDTDARVELAEAM